MTAPVQPSRPVADTPLGHLGPLDLSTRPGLALLRRFDAALHRMPAEGRPRAIAGLTLQWPLAERGLGLMVVPGGALVWRREGAILACDPATLRILDAEAASHLRRAVAGQAVQSVVHDADGLRCFAGWPPAGPIQAATLLAPGQLGTALPQARHWTGPALLRWGPGAVLAWEMAPLQGGLALAASILAEGLAEDQVTPRHWWDAPTGDDRYQLLSSGLSAHLDEVLGQEVSDALRFALVAHWTDGDESQASALADGLGLLPACFTGRRDAVVGLHPLEAWPRAAALADRSAPCAFYGISPAERPAAWNPETGQHFLRAARASLPAGACLMLAEGGRAAPCPITELAADRLARQAQKPAGEALCLLQGLTCEATPLGILQAARGLAEACGVPVLVAVPAWGLCHLCDPAGTLFQGNAAWFGVAGGLEDLTEAF